MKALVSLGIAVLIVLAQVHVGHGASFSFDGAIERESEDINSDLHTLDFIRFHVSSPELLTITGTEGTLPDLSIRLYLDDGHDNRLESSGIETNFVSDTVLQIQGIPAVGDYILAITPSSASDWDGGDGVKFLYGVSGQPLPLGLGTYHLEMTGNFEIARVQEGTLVPEPSTLCIAALGAFGLIVLGRRRTENVLTLGRE